jgi:hypothetical protein
MSFLEELFKSFNIPSHSKEGVEILQGSLQTAKKKQ